MAGQGGDESIDPVAVADLVLGLSVRMNEPVYLEPHRDELYALRVEHGAILVDTPVDLEVARAAIARLAFIAEVDLAGTRTASGTVAIRCGEVHREVVITVRPGRELRADVYALPKPTRDHCRNPLHLTVGTQIANYVVTEQLGEGGMGTVYKVTHSALDRVYALKVLRTNVLERDPASTQQFLREAKLAARIHHPHIVDVFDFGYLADGRPYLVMELLAGQSLADLVDQGAVPPDEVLAIARQLASALAAAHDVGVIHADVTPANALLAGTAVKLVDFGLARLRSELGETATEFVLGTPAYISPEQLRGLPATEHSDQYGLGALLFHLVAGEQPYMHHDLRTLCKMHLEAPVPPVKSPHGALPAKISDVITRCLQKSPHARFPDMHAVLAALDDAERVAKRRDWTRWLGR